MAATNEAYLKEKIMTISISGSTGGTPDHKLLSSSIDSPSGPVEHAVPAAFSFSVWKGHPVLLQEAGDPTEWVVVDKKSIEPIQLPENVVSFKFDLKQVVKITESGETGTVIARSQSALAEEQFLLRYKDASGIAVEKWWGESALEAV